MMKLTNIPQQVRAYAYRIGVAVVGVAVVYGLIDKGDAPSWLLLAAAIFGIGGNGLAAANTVRPPLRSSVEPKHLPEA